ncbi:hypothetical protein [Arthrobacter pascens]|uniref:hypothetical protein n=1 Tax=Arthrobacter pascens TaxID=1677 RepID=UPI0027D8FFF7|nr:hypothetical protein [Arthrobacter pascens]
MTLKRIALIGIPLGLLLVVIGAVGYVNQSSAYLLFWVGLIALALGVGSAFAAAWRKRPAGD